MKNKKKILKIIIIVAAILIGCGLIYYIAFIKFPNYDLIYNRDTNRNLKRKVCSGSICILGLEIVDEDDFEYINGTIKNEGNNLVPSSRISIEFTMKNGKKKIFKYDIGDIKSKEKIEMEYHRRFKKYLDAKSYKIKSIENLG